MKFVLINFKILLLLNQNSLKEKYCGLENSTNFAFLYAKITLLNSIGLSNAF